MGDEANTTKGFEDTEQAPAPAAEAEGGAEAEAEAEGEGEGDENEADPDELAALWEAVREGDQAAIDEMLVGDDEHPPPIGLHVNIADESGMRPLHWLTVEGHDGVAQWLIDDVQAEVDSRDNHSQTPLHHAAVKGQATLVQLLLKRGADPMARDRAGWTPIHACSRSNHTDAALELIATLEPARALVREKTVELDKSAGLDAQRVRKELAKAEDHADMLNVRGPRGETPLHRAAFWGHTGMVQTLLEAGAVAAPVNEAGLTPFDVICKGVDQPLALPAITKLLRSPTPAA